MSPEFKGSNGAERAHGSSMLGRELNTDAGRTGERSHVHLNVNERLLRVSFLFLCALGARGNTLEDFYILRKS